MKRKIVSLIICICLVLCVLPIFTEGAKAVPHYTEFSAAVAPYSGTYSISTAESLRKLATVVNGSNGLSGVTFNLESNIDINPGMIFNSDGTYSGTGGTPVAWTPIGNQYNRFKGTFEGNNHTISGIYINGTLYSQGLFGSVWDGTIRNLGVTNSYIKGGMNVGGIVGELQARAGNAILDNCHYSGTICGVNHQLFGGIVGSAGSNGGTVTIQNCYNTGYIIGTKYVGGVVGGVESRTANVIIQNCYNTGSISGSGMYVGGVAGSLMALPSTATPCTVELKKSYNAGSVTGGTGVYVGGVAGNVSGNANGSSIVSYCYNSGTVTSSSAKTGGVAGYVTGNGSNAYARIHNCYNTARVSGSSEVGGVVGKTFSYADGYSGVQYCYNAGNITSGGSYAGGIAGIVQANHNGDVSGVAASEVQYCYNVNLVTGTSFTGSITGKFEVIINSTSTIIDTGSKVQNCFYDKQMSPTGAIRGSDVIGAAVGCLTSDMTGTDLQSSLGTAANWTFTDDIYPRLADNGSFDMDDTDSAKVSVSPVFLANGETVAAVAADFSVGTAAGAGWTSSKPLVVSILGSTASILNVDPAGVILTATIGTANKSVKILKVTDYYSVTYAKNAGTGTLPTQSDVIGGGTFIVASGDCLTREGFSFSCWFDGTNRYVNSTTYTMGDSNVTLTAVWKANAPTAAPTLISRTDTTITVAAVTGYEYSKDNGITWQTSNLFSGMSPDRVYSLVSRVAASGDDLASDLSPTLSVAGVPTVSSISPSSGSVSGGTRVTISGTYFVNVSAVYFGLNASTYTVSSDTQIIAVSPEGNAGEADITIVTAHGTSATNSNDIFTYTYNAPTVSAVSPSGGFTTGGTSVTISGTYFINVSAVYFGLSASTYTVSSDTQIIAVSPLGTEGAVDITVVAAGGTSSISSADQFTYTRRSSGHSSGNATTTDNGAEVLVNGESITAGTTTTTTGSDGRITTTVAVNTDKLAALLQSSGSNATVIIPFIGPVDAVEGVLTGQMVKAMEDGGATLMIKTDKASYSIPADQIDIEAIRSRLGSNVTLSDIKVSVKIAEPSANTVSVVENASEEGKFEIVVPPIEFTISCSSGGQSAEVSNFNAYVERMIAIPAGIDPYKVTTAVVLNSDNSVSHVPTQIVLINGVYYAKINSLTNSTYTLVWHPVEFTDAATHWAKDAINDMGSRMVVNGDENGNYNPDTNITRAEFSTIIVRALGLKPETGTSGFRDVAESDWYCGYIKTASTYGIIKGFDALDFGPNVYITREQAMTMVSRAMKLANKLKPNLTDAEISALLDAYSDGSAVSDYARDGVAACIKTGIVNGQTDSAIAPHENITRAQIAVMIQRLLQKSGLI